VPIAVDTYKPEVAKAALRAGAHVLNDIYGLQGNPEMAELAAACGAAVVAMHHDARFRDQRGDVIGRLRRYFERSLEVGARAGLAHDKIILDPGIGFFKTQEQNLEIMARMGELHDLGCPLMLAASRKSVIAHVLDLPSEERLEGTLATTSVAVWQQVDFLRVHDVRANLRVARMTAAIRAEGRRSSG
jgi:dihydropteroate synthase